MGEDRQVMIPDSAEARRLAMLAAFEADLTEAEDALKAAESFSDAKEDPDSAICRYLVAYGAVAYGRCFTSSTVRPELDSVVSVPPEFVDAHENLLRFRNGTIGDSENGWRPTYVLADLSHDGAVARVDRVVAMTIATYMPQSVLRRARLLIEELKASLGSEICAARTAAVTSIDGAAADELWDTGVQPQLLPTYDADWIPEASWPRHRRSHEIPIHRDVDAHSPTRAADEHTDVGDQLERDERPVR